MEIDNDAQVQRLRRMLATLSARDMSQTGFEAQIRHQKRIEQVRRAYDAVAGGRGDAGGRRIARRSRRRARSGIIRPLPRPAGSVTPSTSHDRSGIIGIHEVR
ncbi:MAG: hypothetical protein ACE5E6_02505 [Phycisphaerae bacterium]